MNRYIAAIIISSIFAAFGLAHKVMAASTVYKCKIVDGRGVASGKLKPTDFTRGFQRVAYLYLDTSMGKLSWGRPPGIVTAVSRYRIWQQGDKRNDLIAVPEDGGTPNFRELLKINVGGKNMPFLYIREMNAFSGTCVAS